ncbi:MAG: sigma-70 family RNA polymerase sigma factor, partial [Anaeroplasmataceae bacterium]|nr:sigma-70 family RNA polymerase sigma factor [Anaeroplasmataceae bacterium]
MLLIKLIAKLFNKKDEVCYLFNQMSLPEPLQDEEEKEYVLKMLEGSLEARNILIERNMRLVVFIAKRFESPKVLLEDLISIGSMGLIKGVETFKLDKNIKLATYASRCIENEILMFLRKISKQKNEISLDEALNVDGDGNELLLADVIPTNQTLAIDEAISSEKERMMYEAIEKLSPREKEIITLRFGLYKSEELTQKEVADKLGISQGY